MTKNELEKIKRAGLRECLLKSSSAKLFQATKATERASTDYFKNFKFEIEIARNALDDAEQLYKEAISK